MFIVEQILRRGKDHLGLPLLEVKWVGWKHPTWEPEAHLRPEMVTTFDASGAHGSTKYPNLLVDPELELLELSELERELFDAGHKCSTLKEEQKRLEKYQNKDAHGNTSKRAAGTTLATDAGQSVFTWSCNGIGDLMPLYKHESIGQLIEQLAVIAHECPEVFPPDDPSLIEPLTVTELCARADATLKDPTKRKQLVAIFYDDACHLKYSILLRAVGKLAASARGAAGAIYRQLSLIIITVDRMHFKGHLKTDAFCVKNTNPDLYEDVLRGENSQSAEQTFRWMGQFGNMIRTMGQERAYFFLIRMCERHNRRHIAEHIQALDPKKPALRDLCAAYGYTPLPGTLAVDIRAEIIRLLTDATRPYDLAKLDAHVALRRGAGGARAPIVKAPCEECAE